MRAKATSSYARGDSGRGITAGRVFFAIAAVLVLAFIFENTDKVKIRLLIPEVTTPLYLALLAMFVIGMGFGGYLFRRRPR